MQWHRTIRAIAVSLALAGNAMAQDAAESGTSIEITWPTLETVAAFDHAGASRSAYDPASNMLFVCGDDGIAVIHFGQGDDAALVRTINPKNESGLDEPDQARITSVICDPRGRGVAMATIVPRDHATVPGRAVFFETRTGKTLKSITVGYEPVHALWSFGGASVYVANKGSAVQGRNDIVNDPVGTVSWIDVDDLSNAASFGALSAAAVTTIAPGGAALADAIASMRIHPALRHTPALDLEPVALAEGFNRLFVSYQSNNAIGLFDLINGEWKGFHGLGVIDQRLDGCAKDGAAVVHEVSALPMAGELAVAMARTGDAYIITANAGTRRGRADRDDDVARDDAAALSWLARMQKLAPGAIEEHMLSYEGLGGLEVCAFTGDEDDDGVIDQPCALGSRSVSVWDLTTGERVGDTGAAFEDAVAREMPSRFNAVGARADIGSLDRGPKPSALQVARVGQRLYAFVGLERPGAVAVVDLTEPGSPALVHLHASAAEGDAGAVALTHVAKKDNPTGDDLLIGSFADSGRVFIWEIVAPEAK